MQKFRNISLHFQHRAEIGMKSPNVRYYNQIFPYLAKVKLKVKMAKALE